MFFFLYYMRHLPFERSLQLQVVLCINQISFVKEGQGNGFFDYFSWSLKRLLCMIHLSVCVCWMKVQYHFCTNDPESFTFDCNAMYAFCGKIPEHLLRVS